MIPSEGTSRKLPPERTKADQEKTGEDTNMISSVDEIKADKTLVLETVKLCQEEKDQENGEVNGKAPRVKGLFTGKESLIQREEDWMIEEADNMQQGLTAMLSYREALKPKTPEEKKQDADKRDICWDGNLYTSDEREMMRGVKVIDTHMGPQVEFSEEEKRRLEKR